MRPTDAAGVANAVSELVAAGLPFAVRGGGHGPADLAGGDGQVLIDTRGLRGLDVDVPGRVATTGAGLTTGEYTAAVAEHGLATGFGDTPTVGVAGLTLGGGHGFLSRRFGLAIDQLRGAEVVTADGRVLWADASSHPDLFWALRGGGGNFGVVTRLSFALQDVREVYGGILIHAATAATLHDVVAAALAAPDELSTIVQLMAAPPVPFLPPEAHGRPIVAVRGGYVGDPEAGAAALAPLRAAGTPLLDAMRVLPYADMLESPPGPPLAMRFGSVFRDTWDAAAAAAALALVLEPAAGVRAVQLRPLGGAIGRVPTEATAFAHRGRLLLANLIAGHAGAEDLPAARGWIGRAAAALGEGPAAFVSFLDAGASAADAYPNGAWERLRAVKRAYDPFNVFRSNHNVIPS